MSSEEIQQRQAQLEETLSQSPVETIGELLGAPTANPSLGDSPEGHTCSSCKVRPASLIWGSPMEVIHGGGEWRCDVCAITEQLAHARERAAAIPELEKKLDEAVKRSGDAQAIDQFIKKVSNSIADPIGHMAQSDPARARAMQHRRDELVRQRERSAADPRLRNFTMGATVAAEVQAEASAREAARELEREARIWAEGEYYHGRMSRIYPHRVPMA